MALLQTYRDYEGYQGKNTLRVEAVTYTENVGNLCVVEISVYPGKNLTEPGVA